MCLAVPGKVLTKQNIGGGEVGEVQFAGITRQVALGFVPEAEVRDYVMVHVGFAISRLDADEAQRTYEILEQLGALEEERGEESAVARPVPMTRVASGYLVSICGESFEAGESLSTAVQRKLPELKARLRELMADALRRSMAVH